MENRGNLPALSGSVAGNWHFFTVWLKVTAILVDVRHTKARHPTPNARVPTPSARRPTPASSVSMGRRAFTRRFLVAGGSLKEHIMYLDFPVILNLS